MNDKPSSDNEGILQFEVHFQRANKLIIGLLNSERPTDPTEPIQPADMFVTNEDKMALPVTSSKRRKKTGHKGGFTLAVVSVIGLAAFFNHKPTEELHPSLRPYSDTFKTAVDNAITLASDTLDNGIKWALEHKHK